MAKDFRTNQIRTRAIIGSGSAAWDRPKLGLMIYSSSAATDYDGTGGTLLTNVGTDVWMVVDGVANTTAYMASQKPAGGSVLFMGDVVVSGTLWAERSVIEVDSTVAGDLIAPNALVAGNEAMTLGGGQAAKLLVDPFATNVGKPGGASATQDGNVSFNIAGSMTSPPGAGVVWRYPTNTWHDVFFHVSGSRGVRDTKDRGLALFGGDVHLSGNFSMDEDATFTTDIILDNHTTNPPVIKHAYGYGLPVERVFTHYGVTYEDANEWFFDIVHSGNFPGPDGSSDELSGIRLKVNQGATAHADRSAFVVSASGDVAVDTGNEVRFGKKSAAAGPFIRFDEATEIFKFGNYSLGAGGYNQPTSFQFDGGVLSASNGIYLRTADSTPYAAIRGQTRGIMFAGYSGTPGDAGLYYNGPVTLNDVLGGPINTLVMTASNVNSSVVIGAGGNAVMSASGDVLLKTEGDTYIDGGNVFITSGAWAQNSHTTGRFGRADARKFKFDTYNKTFQIFGSAVDYLTIAVDGDGRSTFTTVDDAGANGHLVFNPDGRVGIHSTLPQAELHIGHDLAADCGIIINKGGSSSGSLAFHGTGSLCAAVQVASNEEFQIQNYGIKEDIVFIVANDGPKDLMRLDAGNMSVGIGGEAGSYSRAKLEIHVDNGFNDSSLYINHDDVNDEPAIEIDCESVYTGVTQAAIEVKAMQGLYITQDIADGYAARFYRSLNEAGSEALVSIEDGHQASTQTALSVRQDGNTAGADILNLFHGTSEVVTVTAGPTPGYVGIGVADPDSPLEILNTATQLKLSYDSSNFSTAGVSSAGVLTLSASGDIELQPYGQDVFFRDNAGDKQFGFNMNTGNSSYFQIYSPSGGSSFGGDHFRITVDDNGETWLDAADTGGTNLGNLHIDAEGQLNLNATQPIQIGTDAVAQKIQVGGATTTRTEVELNAILVDINAGTGGVQIDGGAASRIAANSGAMTVFGNAGVNISSVGEVDISTEGALDINVASFDADVTGNISLSGSGELELIGTTGVTIRGDVSLMDNLTVFGDFIKGHVISASIEDPILLLNSGSLLSNTGGGIAIASGSSLANTALIFGRDTDTNNTFIAGRMDVRDGAGNDAISFIGAEPVGVNLAGVLLQGNLFVTASGAGGSDINIDIKNPTDGTMAIYTGDGDLLVSSSAGDTFVKAGGKVDVRASGGDVILSGSDDVYLKASDDLLVTVGDGVRFVGDGKTSFPSLRSDTFFHVSGSKNSAGTAVQGTAVFGGDLVVSGTIHTLDSIALAEDKYLWFNGLSGSQFIYGNGSTLHIDGGALIGVDYDSNINFRKSGIEQLEIGTAGFIWNDGGVSAPGDFRVETVDLQGALLIDNDSNQVVIGSNDITAASATPGADVNVFIDGTPATKDSSTKGTALFAGDLAVSGAVHLLSDDAGSGAQPVLYLTRDSASPAASDTIGRIQFGGKDDGDNPTAYTQINSQILDPTGGSESGKLILKVLKTGTSRNVFAVSADDIVANEQGQDIDFRVESDNLQGMMLSDAAADQLILGCNSLTATAESLGSDTRVLISGSISSKGTTTKGTTVISGDLVVSGAITLEGDIALGDGVDLAIDAGDKLYFNGLAGDQFITGDGTTLTIDGDDTVTVDYDVDTNFQRAGVAQLTMGSAGFVWNEAGLPGAAGDFRVESDTREGAIFVDVSENQVLILSGGGDSSDNEASYTDTAFFVSGSVGSKGGGSKGAALFGGDLVLSGNLHTAEYIYHEGDTDTFLRFQADNITANVGDISFLKMQEVGGQDKFIVNEGGNDIDFRVESSNLEGMLLLDAAEDQLLLGTNSTDASGESLGADTNIFISGSIDSMDSTTKGTAVFGGDLYVSGTANLQAVQLGNLTLTNANAYLRFYDASHYVRKNGTSLEFRDSALGATKTLTQLAALSVVDNTDVFSVTGGEPSYVVTTGSFSFDTDGRPTNTTPAAGGPGADTYFFVSGSKGVKDTSTRGVALFGGDTFTSGTIYLGKQSAAMAPASVTDNAIALYASASAGVTQLYFRNSAGEVKIGSGGSLNDAYDTPTGGGASSAGVGAVITIDGQPVQFVNTGTSIAVGITGSLAFNDTSSNSTPPMIKSMTEGSDLKFGNYATGGGSPTEVFKLTGGSGNILLASNKKVAFAPSEANAYLKHKTISSHGGTTSAVATRNFVPDADNTYTLGTASYRWSDIYTGDLHLKNDRGDWTILEEADMLVVVNNLTGKRYKMNLTPLEENE